MQVSPSEVIAEISGHHNLTQLHAYLEVKPEQVKGAITSLSSLSYIGKDQFRDPESQNQPPEEGSSETHFFTPKSYRLIDI